MARAAGCVAVGPKDGAVLGAVAGRVSGGRRRASGSLTAARSATPAAWRSDSCSLPAGSGAAWEAGRVGVDGVVAGERGVTGGAAVTSQAVAPISTAASDARAKAVQRANRCPLLPDDPSTSRLVGIGLPG